MAELVAAVPSMLAADQADQHYADAVQTAVAACAADTAGQACYICMDGAAEEGLVRGCSCRGASGFAHVSCLVRQAEVAVERGAVGERFDRWHTCGLCEQHYHGVVRGALGWACWKTYVNRPEEDVWRRFAMGLLAGGLFHARHFADALSVQEAELSNARRLGVSESAILAVQANLAFTHAALGRDEEALQMQRDVYSGWLKLHGEEHAHSLVAAFNLSASLRSLQHFEEAKSLVREIVPVARRVLGESDEATLTMRQVYAKALYKNPNATLDDLREAVTTLEDVERTKRRVLGGAHPYTEGIEKSLQNARAALRARETPSPGSA